MGQIAFFSLLTFLVLLNLPGKKTIGWFIFKLALSIAIGWGGVALWNHWGHTKSDINRWWTTPNHNAVQQIVQRSAIQQEVTEQKRDVTLGTIWWCKTRDVCQKNPELVTKFYNDNETMMITAKYIDPDDGVEKQTEYVWSKHDTFGTWGNPKDGGKWRLQYDAMNKTWIGLVSDHNNINKFIQLNMRVNENG